MRVICITQARMGSSRLPGKVLMPIEHMLAEQMLTESKQAPVSELTQALPMLEYHIRRVKEARTVDCHIIATSTADIDKAIVNYCQAQQQAYFCGDEHNVLSRFYEAALQANAQPSDIIIRLTADCPLICPSLIDEAVIKHQQGSPHQYTHVSLNYFPRGFDVEVFSMASLTRAYKEATSCAEREHVTLFLYSEPNALIASIETGNRQWQEFRLCVDEIADFHLVEQVIKALGPNWLSATPAEICQVLIDKPELAKLNAQVVQRAAH
ncbi:acylneuraminate cytidylyltransferase [Shewanella sp. SNU WT4]|uniref:cytidylyltransferase domain-containing protein n=1 Tax=Shewanella sp. SNU WT4 TaxID=2590015 RepID=UPI00112DBF85|nr:glycosyltransferase family protein [Shewanella sp. SNU WT4]QDF66541.1 acylneuraminate cytidylyltransferase [Shewanella sp. SNU WT4]